MNVIQKLRKGDVIGRLLDHPAVERLTGFRVMRSRRVGVVFEEVHLKRFLKHFNVDCVFDVGANEGQYGQMLRRIGYRGHIISFEPVPRALEKLRRNSRKDAKWHVEPVALDAVARETTFNVMAVDQFSSLNEPSRDEAGDLLAKKNTVTTKLRVQTATVRQMYEKYQAQLQFERPYLKMDTQGSDLAIAEGAGETLKSFVGIQSELSIKRLYKDTKQYTDVIDYYRSQGFELSAFVPNNAGTFPYLVEIDCVMYNPKYLSSS